MAQDKSTLWDSGHDESVEVNQRALIDKVLARYSGEFTVFRELLQNSDDAGATAVEVHFETREYTDKKKGDTDLSPDLTGSAKQSLDRKAAQVHQWTFKNNGMPFRDEDWKRLKKIAEGNPDEEKIGAFGVGFYSLFSVTEEPFVTSGDQWMGFYWKDKKDQLFARRGNLPPSSTHDPWTTFEMPLREPGPIPKAFDFTRFLTSSITFMAHLNEVSVYLDDQRLTKLTKDPGVPKSIPLPSGLKSQTPMSTMKATGIQTKPLHIKAEVIQWVYMAGSEKPAPSQPATPQNTERTTGFFASLFSSFSGSATPQRGPSPFPPTEPTVDPTSLTESSVVLSIFAVDVVVQLDQKMRAALLHSTKKNPPTKTRLELIYTGKDEYDASKKEDEQQPKATGSIFQGLRADLEGTGSAKVFIGHSTGQTTGLGGHMAARFIPTVERESIDLQDRNVAVWNKELLYAGGYLARAAYETEMETIRTLWNGAVESKGGLASEPDADMKSWLLGRALHAMKFFTFQRSTPSTVVSQLLEEAFFTCGESAGMFPFSSSRPFSVMSTRGIRSAADVRIPDEAFAGFLKQLPVLPPEILSGAHQMVDSMRTRDIIKSITFVDVLQELRSRPLAEVELVACIKWWVGVHNKERPRNFQQIHAELVNAAILTLNAPGSSEGTLVQLSSIRTFLNTRGIGAHIPTEGPLPDHLLPIGISKQFDPQALMTVFSWKELTILDWLKYITDSTNSSIDAEHNITLSPVWAERVLQMLARAWQNLPKASQEEIITLLREKPCVPTSNGMKLPAESYFPSAHLFQDLPLVTLPSGTVLKGTSEKILQALGVRKHVDLQIVFNRMIKTGDWTIVELIKYLVSVRTMLTSEEFQRLRLTAVFPKESDAETSDGKKAQRFRASDLYEPVDAFRQLGLPLIAWGTTTKWRNASDEAKFLFDLGLRRAPPLSVILKLAAGSDPNIRSLALKYFLDNSAKQYLDYDPNTFTDLAFIPARNNGVATLAKPGEVFTSPMWEPLGFQVVDSTLSAIDLDKLGLRKDPPTHLLIALLRGTPPQTEAVARQWFTTLASRVTDFSPSELTMLSQLPFVPIEQGAKVATGQKSAILSPHLLPPSQCYFSGDSQAIFHSKLFVFVDFGTQGNQFLSACGTKHEPSVEEVARILLENPRKFYEIAEGRDNYLTELRNIAINARLISSSTLRRMKQAPILLGSRRAPRSDSHDKKTRDNMEIDEDEADAQYDLLTPDKVVIVDDPNALQLFGEVIFTAPQEDLLEGFYSQLGSKRLTSLIREEYRTGAELRELRVLRKAQDIRSLILERLPLFLHEHTHTRTRIPFTWLNNDRNFVVKAFHKIVVIKTLLSADTRAVKNQDTTAATRRQGNSGPVELWLSGVDEIDMYEVATSMCRMLFEAPKINDSLLFMTILSTDLRALKRRGYNVDRILRQQQLDRQAAQATVRDRPQSTALIPPSQPPSLQNRSEVSTAKSAVDPSIPPSTSEKGLPPPPVPPGRPNTPSGRASTETAVSQPSSGLSPRPRSTSPTQDTQPPSALQRLIPNNRQSMINSFTRLVTGRNSAQQIQSEAQQRSEPSSHITPRRNIKNVIQNAVRACQAESGEVLQNQEQVEQVKESKNDGYCDVSGHAVNMELSGEFAEFKIFVSRALADVSDPTSVRAKKADIIERFVRVIRIMSEVFALPPASLHIFCDAAGGLVAFNRNASIFLNLRYYEAWHDEKVKSGNISEALIFWYFALAHEIAHNLVRVHNSEHEFWFSSICEEYLPTFAKYLT
ncbi:hypothetical protein CERSUDRAFT_115067 [Gelatoporia subvermispora B]|uniref:Sacsin/Nov domain-containing protein n=1 Tax=Ceriporiopsis subvermispora (strain B) TaxID=914234 RepID=M2RE95_CERS8|nr:hypothetical protein CERSUDRAFT_115067 [Gelatoporia subvermispora B]